MDRNTLTVECELNKYYMKTKQNVKHLRNLPVLESENEFINFVGARNWIGVTP